MDQMDDNSLRYELESRGQDIGPIVDSTRELYRRLLKRLLEEEMDRLMGDEESPLDAIDGDDDQTRDESDHQKEKTDVKYEKSSSRSKFLVFLLTLFLCVVFAYFVKSVKK
ncbi:unnamed protein product [Medioppia subpectinata]|uniref:LEM domain-containing protein n=1 Tax=Medioppia subpectinata TaxID=1979941 RepID=A0A7R9L0W5_9ACAR|nr:unnamed protein product [Medioppia subpectinata]CAG2113240.1 unnamed protein product [Medioppia subpectinata]